MKELIKYLIIGIVQGLGEVLPISSSAHLIIFEEMLGINDDNLTLEVFLHLASLVAIIFFLRKKLIKLISGFFKYLFKREEEDFISLEEKIENEIFLALRLKEGVDIQDINAKYNIDFEKKYKKIIEKYAELNLLEIIDNHCKLTEKGILLSNDIMSEFLD